MIQLHQKNILVTGASSGIGRAVCMAASQLGATVYATGRDTTRLAETMTLLAGNQAHQSIVADIADETALATLVAQLPILDGIVHSAGIIKPLPIKFITPKLIQEVFAINYTAPVCLTAQLFRRQKIAAEASLVFISSISSQYPYAGGGLYVSTKAALEAFARTVAVEYASKKIRANCLLPGLVNTPILEQTRHSVSPEEFAQFEQHYPLGFGDPIDVANAAVFLLSSASRWITGISLPMEGGLTLSSK